ncbi:vomeronasal type-2 receptor 26-like [Hyla sarda]|uniref:vomeronasal type-2 receptor 26-like n=1 Tax=Hyla sarda TaxID=327740 RepID=UPI0024C44644|nr:vomeronasal type-2 receptor 26-like [Hyla sarda]
MATTSLLKHFGWNWVDIIVSDEGGRESELLYLTKELDRHGICTEFVLKSSRKVVFHKQRNIIQKSTSKVIIICGQFSIALLELLNIEVIHRDRTLIFSESWFSHFHVIYIYHQVTNCSLILVPINKPVPGLDTFLSNINLINNPNDPVLEDIYYFHGNCSLANVHKLRILMRYIKRPVRDCTSIEHNFDYLLLYLNNTSYHSVYTATLLLARAIHDKNVYLKLNYTGSRDRDHSWMTKYFLKIMNYIDYKGDKISFTEERQLNSQLTLQMVDLVIQDYTILFLNAGNYSTTEDRQFFVPNENIIWKNGRMPQGRCNDPCSPGYRKAPNGGYHVCCYDCMPCSEGEISNITDSEICQRCPDDGWPDERKVKCVPKTYTFLSYEDDIVTISIFTSLLLSAVTIIILGIFMYRWDSPIVRANNRTVSFILLVSILLSFLCVFLFLGRPVDITCMLRQTVFGIFFSISVSSVLSKTLTVCIAFKATKPGSVWRKLIGVKTSSYVVGICSSIQVLICVSWMSVSPPYQEFDMTTYTDQILIQCNEGSDIWFYSMLGYLGFLAAVSFVLAFMVRTLPDSYNEAKYITFSMLVFCSVWITMIPAYLSTRGKYMVAMEIFAILASSAGLLGCIFLPKCYIIMMKPAMNCQNKFNK